MVGPHREKLWPRPEYADLGTEASVTVFPYTVLPAGK